MYHPTKAEEGIRNTELLLVFRRGEVTKLTWLGQFY